MAKKVSVYVIVPGYYEKFNFLVPETLAVTSAKKLICSLLEKTKQVQINLEAVRLLNTTTGLFVASSLSIQKAGISDGTELLLVGGNNGRY